MLVTPHAAYRRLAAAPEARQAAYRCLFDQAIADDRMQQIRDHLRQQRALGGSPFQQRIEAMLGRCMQTRVRGRPVLDRILDKSL